MPTERYGVAYGVGRENMCEIAPLAVQEAMRQFVRNCSPNWSTVRMDIGADGLTNSWMIRISGEGIRRDDRG